ncbi:ribonuclease H-like domain-containing protein [Tanacetum coccineum]|uniref:Ribonuclease H-like domain-containing protein n=1 Tax=Tanacetum coccineum TaxID=301880 RepID=A0ABQ5IFT8_9ASTR
MTPPHHLPYTSSSIPTFPHFSLALALQLPNPYHKLPHPTRNPTVSNSTHLPDPTEIPLLTGSRPNSPGPTFPPTSPLSQTTQLQTQTQNNPLATLPHSSTKSTKPIQPVNEPYPHSSHITVLNRTLNYWCNAMYDEYNALVKNEVFVWLKQAPRAWFRRFAGYATRAGVIFLSQKKYALQLHERAHMVNCNPSRAQHHLDTDSKIMSPEAWSSTGHPGAWSTSGYCVFLGDNLLSWSAKRQHTISRSSAEAEYRGVANVVAETAWIRNLLRELHSPLLTATLVYCDNVSAVYMSANPVQHQRTKHIEIDIHFVRDMVKAGHVRVLHVPSRFQYADIFTKGLPSALFEDFRSSLSVRPPPAPTARAD